MRIYLDNCCLQRPQDDQTHPRIRVETEAIFAVLAAVQARDVVLLSSEALEYEISNIPDEARQYEVLAVLALASEHLTVSDTVSAKATEFTHAGIQPMDALHLALASSAKADFFCSCDDQLLRRAATLAGLECNVISLLGLVAEVTK